MSLSLILENRNYRWLVSASAVSNLGDGVSARLPWFLFTLPAGVWTDRIDRRSLMVRADLFRMVVTLGVVVMVLAAPPPVGSPAMAIAALCAVAFLLGSAEVLRDNAAQTVLPAVVAREDLESANGQMWSIETIAGHFIGPPLAGVLIALALPVPFGFDALTFALAAALVWLMVVPVRVAPARRSFRVELVEGLRWIWAHVLIWRLAIMLGVINACFMASVTMLVLFSQDVLGLGSVGYGLLLTAGAFGGVTGGIVAPRLARWLGGTVSLRIALAAMAVSLALTGAATAPWIVALALFTESAAGMLWNVVTVSLRQRTIPDDLLGRVNSVYRFFGWGMMPLGALAGGILVTWLEPGSGREAALRAPYFVGAAIIAILGVIGILILRLPDRKQAT